MKPSVDATVASLNAAVRDVVEQAVPCGYNRKSKFPPWFSDTLRYYIGKKNYYHHRFKKKRSDYFTTNSPSTESLLNTLSSLTGLGG
jgi:hypothetical protein